MNDADLTANKSNPTNAAAPDAFSATLNRLTAMESGEAPLELSNDAVLVDQIVESQDDDDDFDSLVNEVLGDDEEGEGGLEDVYGRDEDSAEKGKWVRCAEMGEPGALVRRLGPEAEMRIAKVPNKAYTRLLDLLYRKWQAKHRSPLPPEKLRKALPALYAKTVLTGIRGIKLRRSDARAIEDSVLVRAGMFRRYNPELLNDVEAYAGELVNYKAAAAAASLEASLPNS